MSPQSRATTTDNAPFPSRSDGGPSNLCPAASSVAELARAANEEYALHKIESDSQANAGDANTCAMTRKRSCARISLSPKSHQPFLSSYGSAFLSGIFADIAEASDYPQPPHGPAVAHYGAVVDEAAGEPCHKKARTAASTSFSRQPKSITALAGLADGAVAEVSSPSVVVSPRINESATLKNQDFNDQVRELQDMAFPSLPHIPITVSSSSCSAVSWQASAALRPLEDPAPEEQDSPSYGWFVATDDDEGDAADPIEASTAPTFLPGAKPDLAFQPLTAPDAGEEDLVVQQALAADTIDDVLGDLF